MGHAALALPVLHNLGRVVAARATVNEFCETDFGIQNAEQRRPGDRDKPETVTVTRISPAGADLISSGLLTDKITITSTAPFGNPRSRIATKTTVEFGDGRSLAGPHLEGRYFTDSRTSLWVPEHDVSQEVADPMAALLTRTVAQAQYWTISPDTEFEVVHTTLEEATRGDELQESV